MPDSISLSGAPDLRALIAISLLRSGFDSLAARHAKTVLTELPPPAWLDAVSKRVSATPSVCQVNLEWALPSVDECLSFAMKPGVRALTCLDPDYPSLLQEIPDPPVILWTRGSVDCLSSPSVAIVGSRDALPASLEVARTLGRDLSAAGLTIVSGLARGVDSAAHQGALDAGGMTVAVLGSGLDNIYPPQNRKLAEFILEKSGAVISELPPNAPPFGRHFPLRNRIISGLCRATIVVEASWKSGSLITAKLALDQNRNVLAVPGGTLSGRHRGCHSLLKDGARLVETVEDVLQELSWPVLAPVQLANSHNHLQLSDLEANMAKGEPYTVDDLANRTHRSAPELLTDLCFLELSGRVVRTASGHFVRMMGPEGREGN